jgi:stage II sporulation protein AB (anti-sigma F factor)
MWNKEIGMYNDMKLIIPAISENESLARSVVGSFAARLNPTLEQLADIRTAVSEAVTNAVIHGYEGKAKGEVMIYARVEEGKLTVEITDYGKGIEDIAQARSPFYTSRPDLERSGMGFTIMETFMDEVHVASCKGNGTMVRMVKNICQPREEEEASE